MGALLTLLEEARRQDRARRIGSRNAPKLLAQGGALKGYLRPLRDAMDEIFRQDTAYGDWHPNRPSAGHCMLSAMAVQDLFGGQIVQGEVKQIPHYWNQIGPLQVDLTGDQFGYAPIRIKKGALHPGTVTFYRRPYDLLSQPYNHEACKKHEEFIRRLGVQLQHDGHPIWGSILSKGGCTKR